LIGRDFPTRPFVIYVRAHFDKPRRASGRNRWVSNKNARESAKMNLAES
jgi:hypothetical protein